MGPPRYTDATIVKTLEEKGIGRPSTYAPIISVLLDRYYVVRKSRQLIPTVLGKIINDMLSKSFPELLDPGLHRRHGAAPGRGGGGQAPTGSP